MVIFLSRLMNLLLPCISVYSTDVSQVLSHIYRLKDTSREPITSWLLRYCIASEERLPVNTASNFRSDALSNIYVHANVYKECIN